jgi:DNA-directed RNA polymerase subunit RPC12/RpoP
MAATLQSFRCMMCGHEYQETTDPEEDRERSCPRCRSNSIRHLKNAADRGDAR